MRRTLLACFLSWNAVWVSAQTPSTQSNDEARKNASAHFGPFYVTPAFHLKELGVDTNVFNEAGEQKSDFMFNFSPKADVWVAMARRALITTTVATDLVWYKKYDSERSVDPQASVRAEIYLQRLTLFGQGEYLNTRQRLNYEIDLRTRHVENNFEAGVEYRLTPKLSLSVSGRRADLRFDDDAVFLGTSLQETLNQDTTGFNAAIKLKLTPLTTLLVRGERFTDEFPFSPERDTDSIRVMPGVEFKPRALLNGSAFVGFRKFTPKDAHGVSGVHRPRREPRPVLHAPRRDDVRRQLRARRELLVRAAAAVLPVGQRGRVRAPGARPQVRRAGLHRPRRLRVPRPAGRGAGCRRAASARRQGGHDVELRGQPGLPAGPADPHRLRRFLLGARVHDRLVPRLRRPPHRDVGHLRVLVMQSTQILRQIPRNF